MTPVVIITNTNKLCYKILYPLHDLLQPPQTYSTLYPYHPNERTTVKFQIKNNTFLRHTRHNFNLNKMTSNTLYKLDPPQNNHLT